jgi:hypothetical protein
MRRIQIQDEFKFIVAAHGSAPMAMGRKVEGIREADIRPQLPMITEG